MSNRFEDHAIHESILSTMKALKKAQKVAEYNRDIEAMILISERWMALMQRVDELDNKPKKMIGFISENMIGVDDE